MIWRWRTHLALWELVGVIRVATLDYFSEGAPSRSVKCDEELHVKFASSHWAVNSFWSVFHTLRLFLLCHLIVVFFLKNVCVKKHFKKNICGFYGLTKRGLPLKIAVFLQGENRKFLVIQSYLRYKYQSCPLSFPVIYIFFSELFNHILSNYCMYTFSFYYVHFRIKKKY